MLIIVKSVKLYFNNAILVLILHENIFKTNLIMKKFQHFFGFLVEQVVTLGSYKLLFDTVFSNDKSGLVTMASDSYNKVGLSSKLLDFTEAADKTLHGGSRKKMFLEPRF
jgi:hypothetical protein